jgi:1-phosphofructokinase family hexose kinase
MTAVPRIVVVGPSPAMDRIEILERFELDQVNRSSEVRARPGGKSLIVARTLRHLGAEVTLHGFLGGAVGGFIRAGCRDMGIEDRHTEIAGDTRITPVIVETATGRATVLNEPSPQIAPAEAEAFIAGLVADAGPGDLVVLTGSLPDSLPEDFYGTLIDVLTESGARVAVDTSGAPLLRAVQHRPWMVKPNREEFGALIGVASPDDDTVVAGMRRFVEDGIGVVMVTLGADGVLVVSADDAFRVSVPRIDDVVNATGSGDMMLAGFVMGCARGDDLRAAARLGAALSAANVRTLEPLLDPELDLTELEAGIAIEALEHRGARGATR